MRVQHFTRVQNAIRQPERSEGSLFTAKPEIGATADMPKLFAAVTAKVEEGEITPSEIKTLIDLAEGIRKSLEVVELDSVSALWQKGRNRGAANKITAGKSRGVRGEGQDQMTSHL
ncbi:MAG: hypothetical protein WAN11_06005 [Syntrophobacteraceae bacterium]